MMLLTATSSAATATSTAWTRSPSFAVVTGEEHRHRRTVQVVSAAASRQKCTRGEKYRVVYIVPHSHSRGRRRRAFQEEVFGGRSQAPRFGHGGRDAVRTRATSGGEGSGRDDDDDDEEEKYYEAWAKYPDDPGVPPEITNLLREVGDDREPDVWKTKPPWCQPWTIVLTGSMVVYAPTAVFHAKWLSALVALPIGAWWYLFLIIFPKQFKEYVEAARGYYKK